MQAVFWESCRYTALQTVEMRVKVKVSIRKAKVSVLGKYLGTLVENCFTNASVF
jgi:hypothetical protein